MLCHFVSRSLDPDGEYRYEVELTSNNAKNIAQEVINAGYGVPDHSGAATPDSFETIEDELLPAALLAPDLPTKSPSSAIPIMKPNGEPVIVQKSAPERANALPPQPSLAKEATPAIALPPALPTETARLRPYPGYVGEKQGEISHFNSLDSFYVQFCESENAIHYQQAVLKTRYANNKENVKDVVVGQVVVALWDADEVW